MNDTYLDEIIFDYTSIFPVDEQTALANVGSKDHMDILQAAGVTVLNEKPKDAGLSFGAAQFVPNSVTKIYSQNMGG